MWRKNTTRNQINFSVEGRLLIKQSISIQIQKIDKTIPIMIKIITVTPSPAIKAPPSAKIGMIGMGSLLEELISLTQSACLFKIAARG
jgi:hypothetical protein